MSMAGALISFVLKAVAIAVTCGYTTNQIILAFIPASSSESMILVVNIMSLLNSKAINIALSTIASFVGLTYYLKVWIQDYYFDRTYPNDTDLTGRTAIITGGTVNGLGYAAAELLYEKGANVIITVRSVQKGEEAVQRLLTKKKKNIRASYVVCDFLSVSSIRNCVKEIIEKTQQPCTTNNDDGNDDDDACAWGRIDFLVLNAGISGQQVAVTGRDGGGDTVAVVDTTSDTNNSNNGSNNNNNNNNMAAKVWMTNHLGPFLFASELMTSLVRTATTTKNTPCVVWVSSGAHKRSKIDWNNPFQPEDGHSISSYGQSKLANIMHMREYQKRIRKQKPCKGDDVGSLKKATITNDAAADVKCFAVTPGAVWTNIVPASRLLYPLYWAVLRTPRMGAQVIMMACLERNSLKGGEYLSNCYVKDTEGIDKCSNDDTQWNRLWELSTKQIEEKEYEKYLTTATTTTKIDDDDESNKELFETSSDAAMSKKTT